MGLGVIGLIVAVLIAVLALRFPGTLSSVLGTRQRR